jgi:hypothetical protein
MFCNNCIKTTRFAGLQANAIEKFRLEPLVKARIVCRYAEQTGAAACCVKFGAAGSTPIMLATLTSGITATGS